jgi:hypothetical protein
MDLLAHVITLKSRPDRGDHAKDAAKRMNLKFTLELVDRHSNPAEGCFNSHLSAIRKGARFILEDDFEPTEEFFTPRGQEALKEVYDFVNNTRGWDIMYLGFFPDILYSSSQRAGKHIYKIKSWSCTQAYVISDEFAERVKTWEWNGEPIDVRYRCANSFSVHPQLVKQYDSPSDIRQQGWSHPLIRDIPQAFASWWAMHVGMPLTHVAFACVVMCIMFLLTQSNTTIAKRVVKKALNNSK